jgi:2-polyprenyl-3-methyl-5-hydroxy-6-metoxy-1,4-benzoquinol methylase
MATTGQPQSEDTSPTGAAPLRFIEAVTAYQRTAALKTAIELDLFTAIDEEEQENADGAGASAAAVGARCGAAERGVRILCDYLVVAGFLSKQGQRYALTAEAARFLTRRSPTYIGGSVEFMLAPTQMEAFTHLTEAVRSGHTALPAEGSTTPDNPMWVRFARGMAPMMRQPAKLLAALVDPAASEPLRVLDIAAGHGLYGITIATRNPQAEVTALDWAAVLEVARENARAAGVEARFHTIPGSAFEAEYGTGYDLVLLTNFIHHFDPPTCEGLLRRVHAALREGGRVAILDRVPNEDRVSPPAAAQFALTMLAQTPGGDVYPFAELDRMAQSAGFQGSELHALAPTFYHAVIARK